MCFEDLHFFILKGHIQVYATCGCPQKQPFITTASIVDCLLVSWEEHAGSQQWAVGSLDAIQCVVLLVEFFLVYGELHQPAFLDYMIS